MLHIVRGALWGCLEEPSPPCCPIRTCWFGGPSPPIPLPGAGSRSAGLLQRPGMQTLAFIEGKRLRLHETLPWMPRHPIKGCSTETKCVGVLFPLSPRSPSRFGLGLSARSCGSGKLAASPAPPGARAPSDVVCPKHSSVGKKKKRKKGLLIRWSWTTKLCSCPEAPVILSLCLGARCCLLPAVCGVRQMPFGVCIQRCGGRCWMAARLCQPPLPAPRAEDGLTPQPPAGLSSLVGSDSLPIPSSQPCRSSANLIFPHC